MNAMLVITGIVLHAVSGMPGLVWRGGKDGGQRISVVLSAVGSLAGVAGAIGALLYPAPAGAFLRLDGLAAVFLLPVFLLAALGGLYGLGYWRQEEHPGNGPKLRLFFGLMTSAMAGVTVAAHALVFLVAWEIMALSGFFLITTEDEDRVARAAGFLYLVITHIGTLCLFALFALFRGVTGSFALGPLEDGMVPPALGTALFWLAVTAFGCKAGLMPLHIWLPGAHAAAPSHVSALMSGVLIKIGVYGMMRTLSWLPGVPPLWWGGVLLAAGAVSGVVGVVLALGQHDLKRLLAYHSIENIGIIVMGLGLAMAGKSLGSPALVVLGVGGALLHVWNHALFKALLFLSAGAAVHATHTREIDRLGGLARSMPRTAFFFAVGAAAICGLPPLNGFVSELFIYLGAFRALGIGQPATWSGAALAAPVLALIGGLAVACFVKAFGIVFLGEPRSPEALVTGEAPPSMIRPMFVLALFCVLIGVFPMAAAPAMDAGIRAWMPAGASLVPLASVAPLGWISLGALALLALIGLLAAGLRCRIRSGGVARGPTWDCGYAVPTARMQYTASSFVQILGSMFSWVQRPQWRKPGEMPVFPGKTRFRGHILDVVLDTTVIPAFRSAVRFLSTLRFLQAGNIHAYLFYIVVFLMALLLWR